MNTAFAILARLGMDATAFRADLKQTTKEFRGWIDNLAKLGAGLALGVFTKLGVDALRMATDLDNASKKLGLTTNLIQELGFAGEQFGVSQETTSMALQRFSRRLAEARQGAGELLPILEQYGIQLTDSQGRARSAEEVLGALADTIKKSEDPTERLRIAFKAFDSEGVALVSVLADGKAGLKDWGEQARDSGAVLEEETVKSLAAAQKAIENFKRAATVAVGEIIVNFESKEGLQLLNLQLMKVVSTFGARMIDAITYISRLTNNVLVAALGNVAGKFYDLMLDAITGIATQLNKILPDKLQINVGGIEGLKTAGVGIGQAITLAIANTNPAAFSESVGQMFDDAIRDQQALVDQQRKLDNEKNDNSARALTAQEEWAKKEHARFMEIQAARKDANEKFVADQNAAAIKLEEAGKAAARSISEAAADAAQALRVAFRVTGEQDVTRLSDNQLSEKIRNLESQKFDQQLQRQNYTGAGTFYNPLEGFVRRQLEEAKGEAQARQEFGTIYNNAGEDFARRVYSVSDFERLRDVLQPPAADERIVDNLTDIATRLRRLVPRA